MAKHPVKDPTRYATPEYLAYWMAHALPGDHVEYARGPSANPLHPAVVLVRDWIRTGEAISLQPRDTETSDLVYTAIRVKRMEKAALAQRIRRDEEFEATDEGRLFLLLVRHANLGLPCPTNAELADKAHLRDNEAARYRLGLLEKSGRIRVIMHGPERVVQILETGRRTALRRKA